MKLSSIIKIGVASAAVVASGIVTLVSYSSWKKDYDEVLQINVERDNKVLKKLEAEFDENGDFKTGKSGNISTKDFKVYAVYGGTFDKPVKKELKPNEYTIEVPDTLYEKGGEVTIKYSTVKTKVGLALFPTLASRLVLNSSDGKYEGGNYASKTVTEFYLSKFTTGSVVNTNTAVETDGGFFKTAYDASNVKKSVTYEFQSSKATDVSIGVHIANGAWDDKAKCMNESPLFDIFDFFINGEEVDIDDGAVIPGFNASSSTDAYQVFFDLPLSSGRIKEGKNTFTLSLNGDKLNDLDEDYRSSWNDDGADFKIAYFTINENKKAGETLTVQAETSHLTGVPLSEKAATNPAVVPSTCFATVNEYSLKDGECYETGNTIKVLNGSFKAAISKNYVGMATLSFDFACEEAGEGTLLAKMASGNWLGTTSKDDGKGYMGEFDLSSAFSLYINGEKETYNATLPAIGTGNVADVAFQTFSNVSFGSFHFTKGINTVTLYLDPSLYKKATGNIWGEVGDCKIDYFEIQL